MDDDGVEILPNFVMKYNPKTGKVVCVIAGRTVAVEVRWIKKRGTLEFKATPVDDGSSKSGNQLSQVNGVEVELATVLIEYDPKNEKITKAMVRQMPSLEIKVVWVRKKEVHGTTTSCPTLSIRFEGE